jgi:hypothetical protein
MALHRILVPLLVVTTAPPVRAESERTLLVMDLQVEGGIRDNVARLLNELILSEYQRAGRFQVAGGADLRTVITSEQEKQLVTCSDDACLAEFAGALDADLLAATSLGTIGDKLLVNAKLIDVRRGAVLARVTRKADADEDRLIDTVEAAIREVIAATAPGTAAGAPAPPPAVTAAAPVDRPLLAWIGLGVAGAALAAGGVLLAVAPTEAAIEKDEYATYRAMPTAANYARVTDAVSRSNTLRLAGWTLAGVGAAGCAVASLVLVLSNDATPVSATVVPSPDGVAVGLARRF